jgi:hypothetical protein
MKPVEREEGAVIRRTVPRLLLVVALVAGGSASAVAVGSEGGQAGPDLRAAIRAQERHTSRLFRNPAVTGTAVGVTPDGRASVQVLTARPVAGEIPRMLDGVPVTVEVIGMIRALHHRPGHAGGPPGSGGEPSPEPSPSPEPDTNLKTTDRWPRPVPIGISTGNAGECSAGTIGARVRSGNNVYALSNNHVYARENRAPTGSTILQPGLYDTNCTFTSTNTLGTLAAFVPINFSGGNNTVDAAIASTTTGNLGTSTPSDGYGTPSSSTVSPSAALGQAVQKYGRTTSLTQGVVTGINATVRVSYSSGTAVFVNQIIVESTGSPFIKAGDSGSLLVTHPGRGSVGLLFAGNMSGKLGVANPIGAVLSAFGVTIDGT